MTFNRVAASIFCDDIRQELGGKLSYMGAYMGGDLIIPVPFPTILPRLRIVTWLVCSKDKPPKFITLTIVPPGGEELPPTTIEKPAAQNLTDDMTMISYYLFPNISVFPLSKAGRMEVWIETEEGKIKAGRLNISSAAIQPQPNP